MGVLGKLPQDRCGEKADVARARHLARIEQSVGIGEIGSCHAETAGIEVHLLHETLGGAGCSFGKHIGHVVGGVDEEDLEREVDREGAAGLHAELAWRLSRR